MFKLTIFKRSAHNPVYTKSLLRCVLCIYTARYATMILTNKPIMKIIILIILLLASSTLKAQKLNSENYYGSYSNGKGLKGSKLITAWLDELEVATILEEEMKNVGFEWIQKFQVIKLNSTQYVSSICFSGKSKFGFLFEGTHGMVPNSKTRELKSMYKNMTGNDYAEKVVSLDGDSEFIKIKEIPKSLYILKVDPYWYQKTDNKEDDKVLVYGAPQN